MSSRNFFVTNFITIVNFFIGRAGTRHSETEGGQPGGQQSETAGVAGAGSRDPGAAESLRTADTTTTNDTLTDDDNHEQAEGPAEGAGGEQVDIELVEEEEVSDTGTGIVTDGSLNSDTEREAVGVPGGVSDGTGTRVRPRPTDLIPDTRWTRVLARLVWPPHWRCGGLRECLRCVQTRVRREQNMNNHQ